MTHTTHRRDIDGLRALAVVPVVLGHAGLRGVSGGFVGVDVFFVISGYLITGILARDLAAGQFSLLRFYERRARRILPALFVVLAACLAGGYLVLPAPALEELAQSAAATLLFVSNMWFWQATGDYFGTAAELDPLLHTWSLAVEEQFYIFFPLILWAMVARGRRRMIALIAILSLLSFLLSVWATPRMPDASFFFAPTRAWELGLGALLALCTQGPPRKGGHRMRAAAGLLGLMLIAGPVVLYTPQTLFPGWAALPPCLGTVLILWSGRTGRGPVWRILSLAPFVWIGLISYSLYLWHWPVQVLFRVLGNTVHLSLSGILASVVLATALAWLSWRFVEQPFRRAAPRGLGRKGIFAMSLAGTAGLGALSLAVITTQGLPARIPAAVLASYEDAVMLPPLHHACFGRSPGQGRDLCRIGATGHTTTRPATVLFWGDSHADALLPGVDHWMADHGLSGYVAAKSGCPPLPGLVRADRGPGHGCNIHNAAVLAFVEAAQSIDTVILHARWPLAVEGLRPPGEPGKPALFAPEGALPETAQARDNHDRVAEALHTVIARLRAGGLRVIIIDSIPEIGWSVPEALFGKHHLGLSQPPVPTIKMAQTRNRRFRAIVEPLLKDGGVRLISITPELCAPDCKVEEAGHALYRDDDHLSVWAAQAYGARLMNKAFSNF